MQETGVECTRKLALLLLPSSLLLQLPALLLLPAATATANQPLLIGVCLLFFADRFREPTHP